MYSRNLLMTLARMSNLNGTKKDLKALVLVGFSELYMLPGWLVQYSILTASPTLKENIVRKPVV